MKLSPTLLIIISLLFACQHAFANSEVELVTAEELIGVGEEGIRKQLSLHPGDEALIIPTARPRPLPRPNGLAALEAAAQPPRLRGGLWRVTVLLSDGDANQQQCVIRYRLQVMADVLVTQTPVRRGEELQPDMFILSRREISSARGVVLRSPGEIIGLRATRPVGAGELATTEWLEPIPLVRRGEAVRVVSRVGRITAEGAGIALSDGGLGRIITVQMRPQGKEMLVRISGPGIGEVVNHP